MSLTTKSSDEHQRRSADCPFFSQPAPKAKAGRGKKARASKVSRLSSQSNLTTALEDLSIAGSVADNNEGIMVLDNDMDKPHKARNASKKGTKAKKSNAKPRGKAAKAGMEESMQASSFVEAEDDDFEVKVAPQPKKATRGRKRKSEEVQEDPNIPKFGGAKSLLSEPPAKKRATRTRASSIQPENHEALTGFKAYNEDTHMVVQAAPPMSKKGERKRGSSTVRKASATSTASMASLRAPIPDDSAIEAALEADLDRPLTDDEAVAESPPRGLTKIRRLTRTRPGSRNGPASIAPTRTTTRMSTASTDRGVSVEFPPKDQQEPENALEPEIATELEPKAAKAEQSRNATRKVTEPSVASDEYNNQETEDPFEEPKEERQEQEIVTHSKAPKTRQVSRRILSRKTRASELSPAPSVEYPILGPTSSALSSSVLGPRAADDESGHETDASLASQALKKAAPKKGAGRGRKPKAGKKTGNTSRNTEDIVEPGVAVEVIIERPPPPETVIMKEPAQIPEGEAVDITAPKKAPKRKAAKSTKAKSAKAIVAVVPSSPSASQMSEPWSEQPLGESTPLQLSRPLQSPRADMPAFTPIEAAEIAPPARIVTPEKIALPEPPSAQKTPRRAVSPQSSDGENRPPSSRPSALRPPLEMQSPSKAQTIRVPLAASTPTAPPSRRNISKLQTSMPWTVVEIDRFLLASPNVDKENSVEALRQGLASPEKNLTIEEWIYNNARKGEEKLRSECERLVGRFEGEGVRALKTLEGIVCAER